MRLLTEATHAVVDHLNHAYFNEVWNSPDASGRANVQITKTHDRVQTGAVSVGLSVVGLPTTDAVYAVYQASYQVINRYGRLPDDMWVTAAYLTQYYGISLAIYSVGGKVYPPDQIYLLYRPMYNQLLIALNVRWTQGTLGELYPDLYMTVYKDTTRQSPIVSQFYTVRTIQGEGTESGVILSKIVEAKTTCPLGTTVFINGWVYDPDHIPALQSGDIVSIVSDPDVIGYCDIEVDNNQTGYQSTRYGGYRELLHIPKLLNPDNIVLTNDLVTTVVFDTQTNKGVLGHRVDAHAIESVTHNDFSMGRQAIQDFSQTLGALNVKVRLYVRYPDDKNYLNEDVNHLRDLYALSDTVIVQQLLGLASPQIAEWRANKLETSGYLDLLYNFPGEATTTAIATYADAMGYYGLASTLGQQMRFYTYEGSQVKITKPAHLTGIDVQAIVYANGLKVQEEDYQVSVHTNTSFLLGFTLQSRVTKGDRIAVYICPLGYRSMIPFTPTEAVPFLDLDNEDYALFEIKSYTEDQTVWKAKTRKGYKKIPLGPADYTTVLQSNGTYRFEVKPRHYGKAFYLSPNWGLSTAVYNVSSLIEGKNPLILALSTADTNGYSLPMIGYETMEIYLNGHRLTDGLDYICKPVVDSNNYILQTLLTVSNQSYLNLEIGKNILEVVVHGDKVVSQDNGYTIENHLYRNALPMIWTKASSRVFVDGVLQEHVEESGSVINPVDPADNGLPFYIEHNLAIGAEKLLHAQSPAGDINLRARIDHVLGIVPPDYPDTIVVPNLHALYSPFLAQIVTDVGEKRLVIKDEPAIDRFFKQFEPYKFLLERDPVVGPDNKLVDRHFVTVAAHYRNFAVNDPAQMMRIQRLVNLTLTPSELSINEVLL